MKKAFINVLVAIGLVIVLLVIGLALSQNKPNQNAKPVTPTSGLRPTITITPVNSETMQVNVFFGGRQALEGEECTTVYPLERQIPKTSVVARAALEELLKGPTASEKNSGYYSSINDGVMVQKLIIENGVAKVDFDKRLEEAVGGSCRVTVIRTQITQTLKQFPTVKEVVISIDGRTEDILQP